MKFRPLGAELFHADGQTNMTKVIVAFRHFAKAPNKTADPVRLDVVHLLYHGVFYCKSIGRFHGTPTKVISSRPLRKVLPSLSQIFTKLVKSQTAFCADPLYRISSKWDNKFGKYGFTLLREVGFFFY